MLRSTATQRLTAMPGDRAVDNVAKRRKGEERRGTGTARGSPGRRADWKAPSGTPMSILGSVRPPSPDPSESLGPIVSSSTARKAGLKARSSGSGSHWPGVSHGLCPAPGGRRTPSPPTPTIGPCSHRDLGAMGLKAACQRSLRGRALAPRVRARELRLATHWQRTCQ
jgi:hypothetical protein